MLAQRIWLQQKVGSSASKESSSAYLTSADSWNDMSKDVSSTYFYAAKSGK
jgi:hypothetical protein